MSSRQQNPAVRIIDVLGARGQTVATAESLTAGRVCVELTAPPGASRVVCGGVVAYLPRVKTELLGVPAEMIATAGVVSAEVAGAMADGARAVCGAQWGLGTTGAAGPKHHDGQPPGTVWTCVATPSGRLYPQRYVLDGDRDDVCRATTDLILRQLLSLLDSDA
ncbi:MAG TPA: nicotinamide-nucleotide amidohydrolase family protein [Candidatus Stackebrandtia faecavium]|nr:nicotinamide-nucleotide amidohydrolase family protein [Candidatus Stackebrandtia faecavium]